MGMCDNMHTHATLEHATASSPQGQAKQDGKDIAATIRNECALVLKRKSTSKADNPLGVVPVAESVMPGHADVVSEELICMVGKLLGDIETSRQ